MKFRFRAKQGPQDQQEGEIEAANERMAVSEILRRGLTPIEIEPLKGKASKQHSRSQSGFSDRIKFLQAEFFQTDLVLFTRFLADFLNAGISVLKALQLIRKYFPSGRMARSLEEIEASVTRGDSLSVALRSAPRIFSDMYVNMIQAGEVSGSLSETTGHLADFLEQDQDNRLKVASSLIYPMIIVCVAAATLFVLLTWVIPRIMVIFEEMDQSIPMITRGLMALSSFFANFWWLILAALILIIMVVVRFYQTHDGRKWIDEKIFFMPGLGSFIREVGVARFSRTLASLVRGGVDVIPALGYASRVVGNQYIQEELDAAAASVKGGTPLSQALGQSDIFSDADISMLAVGEETGALSTGLFKLASFYEKNNDRMIKVITTMVEPVLILGLGLIIGLVVLAMLMPIFQMNLAIR